MKTTPTKAKTLTRKQAAFVRAIIENPKISATEAAARSYDVTSRMTAGAIASENLQKPQIQQILRNHAEMAEQRIATLMKQDDDKRLAFDAARDIQDRVHGKATQRVEQATTTVKFTIDLSSPSLPDSVIDGEIVE